MTGKSIRGKYDGAKAIERVNDYYHNGRLKQDTTGITGNLEISEVDECRPNCEQKDQVQDTGDIRHSIILDGTQIAIYGI